MFITKYRMLKTELDFVINNLKQKTNEGQCKEITHYLRSVFWNDYYSGQEFLIHFSNLRFEDINLVMNYWKVLIKEAETPKIL